ncbi:MAG: pyruvate dehydrogenase complex dihydrolipoamide acetyltransferase [Hyphomicrobiales bacterium]|nr:pyruvate dehydrogenase complex dihydrolipoamide acetyltransferase [Hyphomicrobiales bacterium]
MSITIFMPALSPTMEMGNLVKWIKNEGDQVASGEIIAEIETDKAVMEFESADDGILGKILVKEGTVDVKVNQPIAILLEEGENINDLKDLDNKQAGEVDVKIKPLDKIVDDVKIEGSPKIDDNNLMKSENIIPQSENVNKQNESNIFEERKFISPLAKRIAIENNIDITNLSGSGPNGRIIKKDINQIMNVNPINIKSNNNSILSFYDKSKYAEKLNDNMRMVIAKRLEESNTQIPSYTLNLDCSISKLNEIRETMNSNLSDQLRLSINHFLIKITSMAMLKVPEVNSTWLSDRTLFHKNTDIGIAVALENGLITPIIRDVEKKGLMAVRDDMKILVEKAREKKLSPSEYQGGTISISNLGSYGIKNFTSIINPPQSSILSIGTARKVPVIINDAVSIDDVMSITLTADHRLIDGAVGAAFISYMKQVIENPTLMLL